MSKNLIGIIISVILVGFVIVVGSLFMLESSLPEYDGELKVTGLNNLVEVYRDEYAIPFVNSSNENDAYFSLGFLHAQERLFQMDLSRRAGQGRLSEVLGNKTVKFDKLFRTLELARISKKNYDNLDDKAKSILSAYSNGINEFIKKHEDKFSIEFDILGYKPDLWKPEHSVLLAKLMAWELNISWWSDIAITHLIQKLGKEKVEDILPNFDENAPTIIPSELNKYSFIPTDLIDIDKKFREFIGISGTHIGSNNWVVNGKRSVSGKPIIANDPHLSFSAPGKWYIVTLNFENKTISGFTLPGIPGIVIGKNNAISWVLTNVMADDADFYVEKLDSSKQKYLLNGEWKSLEIKLDTIKVKDSTNVILPIRKTHRGPIVSDIHNYNNMFPNKQQSNATISMRWSALEFGKEMQAFYKINNAKNWKEFNAGVYDFAAPGQNFVYADSSGNIGYVAGVKLPIRYNNSPSFIFDGTTDRYDWTGYVPYNENPKLFNPTQGFIASANNKTIMNYKYHISNIWEPDSRIKRITELLDSKNQHSIEDFKKYQNDFFSHFAKKIQPYIIESFSNENIEDNIIYESLDLVKGWDFYMNPESQVPTIFAVFFQNLLKNIFLDEMGKELFNEYIFIANIPYRVVPKLIKENKSSWFDNINTSEIEDRDEIIRKSFYDAVKFLQKNMDEEIANWQWGNMHKVTFKHFFHGVAGIMDAMLDIGPFKIGGDGTTVFNTEYSFTKPFENKLGPSMRYIYDFSNPDYYECILPTGQAGNFYNNHYDDMTKKWLEGEYIKVDTNSDSVKNNYKHLLKLFPNG